MLNFEIHPSIKDRLYLLRLLKMDSKTRSMLNANTADNMIAAIYNGDALCGGALLLGNELPVYMFCFFEQSEYCTQAYYQQIKEAIAAVPPYIKLFEVYCIN